MVDKISNTPEQWWHKTLITQPGDLCIQGQPSPQSDFQGSQDYTEKFYTKTHTHICVCIYVWICVCVCVCHSNPAR